MRRNGQLLYVYFNELTLGLSIQVEMLIRAHDCYSLCCSVDGIGEVLKVAREITTSLYQGKYYKLMVINGRMDE